MSSSSSLAQLIIKDSREEAPLHPAAAWVRERFPANEMMPLIERREGKPSERVRMRRALQELREEGLRVECPDIPDRTAPLILNSSFDRSGRLRMARVRIRTSCATDEKEAAFYGLQLARVQERLLEEAIPMLAHRELGSEEVRLQLHHCTHETLPWLEAGLGEVWDMPMDEAMQWADQFGISSYRAGEWRDAGFDLAGACEWHRNGDGFYWPDDALGWMELASQGMTSDIAIQLDKAGISVSQALKVRELWPDSSSK